MNRGKIKTTTTTVIVNIVAIFISIVSIFPIFWLFYSSLKTKEEFLMDTISLPEALNFSNYPKAFQIGNLWNAMTNSGIYTIINVVLVSCVALIVAYFVSRFEFKGRKFFYYMFMIGMLIPLYSLLVPVFVQYKVLGLINNRLSLIISYYAMSMPLAIFLYESFICGIPIEIDEASIVDGCTLTQRIFKIIFPLCKPIMATIAILTALQTWNEFAFATVLTPSTQLRTVSVALRSYSSGLEVEYTFLMAGLFAASLPILLVYFFFSKQVVQGMVAGAVKG